jgi:TrpR-related protein YerC/YecD
MNESKITNSDLEGLYKAMLKLRSVSECKKFFRDLCTLSEIEEMTERFKVVQMVNDGLPYRDISKKTGSSTATITRISHWLHHGEGGYKLVLARLK